MSDTGVTDFYARRVQELRVAHRAAAARLMRVSNLRLAAFAVAAGLAVWAAHWATDMRAFGLCAATLAFVAFVGLVLYSSKLRTRARLLDDLVTLNDQALQRLHRNWPAIKQSAWEPAPPMHPYANDLDVFGPASLVQLLPPVSAAPGRRVLRSWMLAPAPTAEVLLRQQSVAELTPRVELREKLAVFGSRITVTPDRLSALTQWAEHGETWVVQRPLLVATTVAVPLCIVLLILAQVIGVVSYPYWLIPMAVGAVLTLGFSRSLGGTLSQVAGRASALGAYVEVTHSIADELFRADTLIQIQNTLTRGDVAASRGMRLLQRWADCAELRASPLMHFVVQSVTLWDFHVVHLLERWKQQFGARVHEWMSALGTAESIAALATLAHDNPGWVFPDIAETGPALIGATALGHPLLPDATRVPNDVTVGPPGTLLVVTGSNMAGKSTLLRTIGLNMVLAQAGSVVCASAMRCTPVSLHTSMRVQDSLERGVSYFMAELERLKLIVDAADLSQLVPGRTVLYLLDEILHGTNSAERGIAARHVLAHLVAAGAIGAVSTHDLDLADSEVLAAAARHVHLQETFARTAAGSVMSFDYLLRPGKATSSNALRLLELVGLTAVDIVS
ncbi:MAG: MutS-related protein [Gemmatimonadaceae bacterium]